MTDYRSHGKTEINQLANISSIKHTVKTLREEEEIDHLIDFK